VLLIVLIFAIIGINLFKGKSYFCDMENIIGLSNQEKEKLIETKTDCINYGGDWCKYHYNFDDISNSMI